MSLLPVADAQAAILSSTPVLEVIEVPSAEASGHVLARDIHARWDRPGRDVSIMDGWAVRTSDLERAEAGRVELVATGESAAGHPSQHPIAPGHAARISTGAVMPDEADAVVPQEDVATQGGRVWIEPDRVTQIVPGRFVRARGSDVRAGERLLGAGTVLRPGGIAAAASCGHAVLPVHRRPTVAILGTGDELVPSGTMPAPGQVVSTNGMMLCALVRQAGGVPRDLGDVGDDEARLEAALREGLQSDVLVTSGGISVGDHDLVHAALQRLGARTVFRRVALQPGKPTTFLRADARLIFALPGNPASTLVAFELFVRPALRRMAGWPNDPRRPLVEIRLGAPALGDARREHYVRAQRREDAAWPLPSQLSGNLRSIADFDLLLRIPAGVRELPAGARCDALVMDEP
jgi:molybdopterin molybdotransferase